MIMTLKENLDQCFSALNIALNDYIWEAKGRFFDGKSVIADRQRQDLAEMMDDFKQLSSALDLDIKLVSLYSFVLFLLL